MLLLELLTELKISANILLHLTKKTLIVKETGYGRMIYFHIPILVMMVTNLSLYLVMVYHLVKHNKQTRAVRESRR